MALQRRMGTGKADSLDTRHAAPIPVTGRSDPGSRQVKPLDGGRRRLARERVVSMAPPVAVGSLLALVVAELASVAAPVELVLVAIASAALIALRSDDHALRQELREARVTAVDAIDLERSRIQHDLHDSIQQRLISIRIRLADLADLAPREDVRQALERLGTDVDTALSDIRSVTWGSAPQLLDRRGLRDALREAVAQSPLQVVVEFRAARRYAPDVERCVYFCCLEALQNVLKHAGSTARAWIRVTEWAGWLTFEVEDSGAGFDLARIEPGLGIASLTDRVGALGGRLRIETHPGSGTLVHGEIPLV
jgi:signal transduction histidine kinase